MKSYKGYKEMTRCVLEARDEHLKKKQRQQAMFRKCVPAVSSFCVALILGFGFWKHINKMPEIESISPTVEATTESVPATEKESSTMDNTENKSTQKPTEQTPTQNVTSNEPATSTSQEASSTNANIETINPTETEQASETVSIPPTEQPTTLDGDQSGCTDNHIYLHWDEMTINQQYFYAEFGEPTLSYSTAEKEVSANEVGEYISQAYMSGYDWYELIYYHCETEAYRIKGDDEAKTIAIKFEDDENYYLYTLNESNNDDEPSD
ncbi:MAG: hypothetical protein IKW96_12610 [Ruminococcus sp.]|uniref:hypothetical protein n=1 Tax=Ruminococcus sp. TaxID=41978 RepID=UPI0025D58DDD|nr:hypothetical protein [Ruminococcus sp.]MBR5684093.1 hypothetical protein [Ruminococcus sp.]